MASGGHIATWPYGRERVMRPHLRRCASLFRVGPGTLSQKWPGNRFFRLQKGERRAVPANSGNFPLAPGETI